MNRLTRILVWPLVAILSTIACAVFMAAVIGGITEWIFN